MTNYVTSAPALASPLGYTCSAFLITNTCSPLVTSKFISALDSDRLVARLCVFIVTFQHSDCLTV